MPQSPAWLYKPFLPSSPSLRPASSFDAQYRHSLALQCLPSLLLRLLVIFLLGHLPIWRLGQQTLILLLLWMTLLLPHTLMPHPKITKRTARHPWPPLLLDLLVQAGIHRQSSHPRRNLNFIAYLHAPTVFRPHVRVHPVSLFFHLNQPSINLNLVLASKIFQTTVSILPLLPALLTLLTLLGRLVLMVACVINLLFPPLISTLMTIDTVQHV